MKYARALLLAVVMPAIAHAQPAPPMLRVTLDDGREVQGEMDDATTDRELWLRQTTDRIVLAVPYAWDSIARAEVDGQELSIEQLREDSLRLVVSWPEGYLFDPHEKGAMSAEPNLDSFVAAKRPASVAFEAMLANWDGDVEPDGYEIAVTVFDELGMPMPVRGTLSARLVGQRVDHQGRHVANLELERWSERVDLCDFAGGPAIFRLPFQQTRPERQLDIAPGAVLAVEVGAFGHGRYAASAAVPVREFNPVRDRLQQATGSRFFHGERAERPSRLQLNRP